MCRGAGGILTVADDLLKNDGKKFIEMMEQLAERRMQREEEAQYVGSPPPVGLYSRRSHPHGPPPPVDDDDDEFDDEDEEYDSQDDYDDEEDEMVLLDLAWSRTTSLLEIGHNDRAATHGRRPTHVPDLRSSHV